MRVSIICVITICGRIEPAGIGSHLDRRRLEEARLATGATLLGGESLRKSDPEMRCTGGKIPQNRIRALISESGNIPSDRKIFKTGPRPLIFTSDRGKERLKLKFSHEEAEIITIGPSPHGGLSLAEAISVIEQRGVEKMLIEGGGRLNYSALQQRVADEILLTIAPRITGHTGMSALVSGPAHLGGPFMKLELSSCKQIRETGELFLTYKVRPTNPRE